MQKSAHQVHTLLQKTFFLSLGYYHQPELTPIDDRNDRSRAKESMPSVREYVPLMGGLLCELCAEKNENAIGATRVFAHSCGLFKQLCHETFALLSTQRHVFTASPHTHNFTVARMF